MLLVDASNLFYSTAQDFFGNTKEKMTMQSVRHVLTNKLALVSRDMKKYGKERVLAFDDRQYWRREVFPYYKASRVEMREKSKFDWDAFFEFYGVYKDELRENFPFKCIQVRGAEADDVAAVLAPRVAVGEEVCVWSSDTDNLQIQNIDPRIKQFSYVKKKLITPASEKYNLFDHVVRGDAGDGIPNIYSTADHFVRPEKKRQKSIMATSVAEWQRHAHEPEKFCSDVMLERYRQNQVLIDYRYIPEDIAAAIVDAYESATVPQGKIFGYMVQHKLTRIMQDGGF